jgi:glycosyltransferase involved in cell wall biosynthesis
VHQNNRIPVLFLVMEFAPVNTTGNFRSLKFVKYLHEFGFEPIVVTLKEEEAAEFFNAKIDPSLMNDVPADTPVYRIHCDSAKELYRNKFRSFLTIYFSIKDSLAKRWKKHLNAAMPDIMARHKPKLIFTSLPPFSCGMLAAEISRQFAIPLVVDMRDFWAMWGSTPFPSKLHYTLTLKEERAIFDSASAILGVTPQLISQFRISHQHIDPTKFHLVSNGFDKPVENVDSFTFPANKRKIVIGYVGSFYYYPEGRANVFKPWWKKRGHHMLQFTPIKEDWLYRSPYFFFKAVAQLISKHPHLTDSIELHFVGKKPTWFDAMVNEF